MKNITTIFLYSGSPPALPEEIEFSEWVDWISSRLNPLSDDDKRGL